MRGRRGLLQFTHTEVGELQEGERAAVTEPKLLQEEDEAHSVVRSLLCTPAFTDFFFFLQNSAF